MTRDREEEAAETKRDRIAHEISGLAPDAGNIAEVLKDAEAQLDDLGTALSRWFEQAFNAHDGKRVAVINRISGSVTALAMNVNQLMMRRIDDSAEVKDACAKIGAINKTLKKAADKTSAVAEDLDKITGVAKELTTLINWLKNKSKG